MLKLVTSIFAASLLLSAAGCANTIRGAGQDTANAVNATQAAGQDIEQATY